MFKRIAALAMLLAGSMAVFTPAVAQARDRGYYPRYERHCHRPYRHYDRWDRRWR